MKRIVYTIAVGKPKFAECALGLGRSLKLIGDRTRRVIVTDLIEYPWDECFDEVISPQDPIEWIYFSKLSALDRTQADQVLFIDGDSLVFRRLDDIFNYCSGKGFCVQGDWVRSGEWYGDVESVCRLHSVEELPQFNGGMIYYERTPECEQFIQDCYAYGRRANELGFKLSGPLVADEPCIALLMAKTGRGHLIPSEMDFQSSATGLIGKLNLDVLTNRCDFVNRHHKLRFIRPYIFHASRYINFLVYWRQIDALRNLRTYELKHRFGYMSPKQKFERSVERRLLKYVFRRI